jgi:hypothetical protein
MSTEDILKTEYSTEFDRIRKNMMVVSYYKYGAMEENYKYEKTIDAIGSLEKRLQRYKDTGNTEFLADIANFAMIEFMYPQHEKAHYKPTDNGACEIEGFGVNEAKNFQHEPVAWEDGSID